MQLGRGAQQTGSGEPGRQAGGAVLLEVRDSYGDRSPYGMPLATRIQVKETAKHGSGTPCIHAQDVYKRTSK